MRETGRSESEVRHRAEELAAEWQVYALLGGEPDPVVVALKLAA